MISIFRNLFLLALLAGLLVTYSLHLHADTDAPPPTPDVLLRHDDGAHLWISASRTFQHGELDWSLFDNAARQQLERDIRLDRKVAKERQIPRHQLKAAGAGYLPDALCGPVSTVFDHFDDPKPRQTLNDLWRYSVGIFETRVVGVDQGFVGSSPASLLQVEVLSSLRMSEHYATSSILYIVYPYAAFALGEDVFCRADPRFTYRPAVGDRLLLFPSRGPIDPEARVMIPEAEEILAFRDGNPPVFGGELARDPELESAPSLDVLKELLLAMERQAAGEEG